MVTERYFCKCDIFMSFALLWYKKVGNFLSTSYCLNICNVGFRLQMSSYIVFTTVTYCEVVIVTCRAFYTMVVSAATNPTILFFPICIKMNQPSFFFSGVLKLVSSSDILRAVKINWYFKYNPFILIFSSILLLSKNSCYFSI